MTLFVSVLSFVRELCLLSESCLFARVYCLYLQSQRGLSDDVQCESECFINIFHHNYIIYVKFIFFIIRAKEWYHSSWCFCPSAAHFISIMLITRWWTYPSYLVYCHRLISRQAPCSLGGIALCSCEEIVQKKPFENLQICLKHLTLPYVMWYCHIFVCFVSNVLSIVSIVCMKVWIFRLFTMPTGSAISRNTR